MAEAEVATLPLVLQNHERNFGCGKFSLHNFSLSMALLTYLGITTMLVSPKCPQNIHTRRLRLSSIEIMRCYGEKRRFQLSQFRAVVQSRNSFRFWGGIETPTKNIVLRTSHQSTCTITLIQFLMKNTCARRITNDRHPRQ